MDPSTWPPGIRKFIDDVGSKANGELIVGVEYTAPVWTITLGCPCCQLVRQWNLVGELPVPLPGAVDLPSAFREILT